MQIRWESTRRYYVARLDQDLFSQWTIERCWGGLFNRIAGSSSQPVADYAAGLDELTRINAERKARRYQPC